MLATASVWKSTPFSFVILAISLIGSIVPTSPLACMIETRIVSSRIAFLTSSGLTVPFLSTGTAVYSKPHFSRVLAEFSTEKCSMEETTMCFPFFCCAIAKPLSAKLLDSVPLPVKMISSGLPPINCATCPRANSIPSRGISPHSCRQEGLPKESVRYGSMTYRTSGSTGVVAVLSRYTFFVSIFVSRNPELMCSPYREGRSAAG